MIALCAIIIYLGVGLVVGAIASRRWASVREDTYLLGFLVTAWPVLAYLAAVWATFTAVGLIARKVLP